MTKEVIIETKSGRVKGLIRTSLLGDQYFSFQKIPYAKAPIGELRFKAPVPIDPWNTTLDATSEGPVPYYAKTHFVGLPKSEDCLHLNVYSKNVTSCKFEIASHFLNYSLSLLIDKGKSPNTSYRVHLRRNI